MKFNTIKIHLYKRKKIGLNCTCKEPHQCTICYGTKFVGGYDVRETLEAQKLSTSLVVADLSVSAGDLMWYKDKGWKIVQVIPFYEHACEFDYRSLEDYELAALFLSNAREE